MPFNLPVMPYEMNSLEPHISSETLEFHYGKLHQSYINNLNGLTEGTDLIDMPIEKIIMNSKGGIYNNATQVWNHTFYWNCMSPSGGGKPLNNNLVSAINRSFGAFSEFKVEFSVKNKKVITLMFLRCNNPILFLKFSCLILWISIKFDLNNPIFSILLIK